MILKKSELMSQASVLVRESIKFLGLLSQGRFKVKVTAVLILCSVVLIQL